MSDHVSASLQGKHSGAGVPGTTAAPDRVIAADSSTFAPGIRLLPESLRADVRALYDALRSLDDLVDEDDPRAGERVGAVEEWARGERDEGAGTGEGVGRSAVTQTSSPETQALAELAGRRSFPRAPLLEFCEGMRHDIAREPIEDEQGFERYCQRAGGSVGVVLANLLGAGEAHDQESKRECERRMATLGRAMQVTNILRDIDEDLAHDRVYIPRSAIERFGFPVPGRREELLREYIALADTLYEEGLGAIGLLREGARAMALSADLYREILRQIEREGFGRSPQRAVVPAWRRKVLIAKHRLAQR